MRLTCKILEKHGVDAQIGQRLKRENDDDHLTSSRKRRSGGRMTNKNIHPHMVLKTEESHRELLNPYIQAANE